MKHSIRLRMAVTFGAIIIGTVVVCLFINNTFLGSFYEKSKIKGLCTVYDAIDNNYTGEDDEDFIINLEKRGARLNANVYIFDIFMYSDGLFYQVKYPYQISRYDQEQLKERIKQYYAFENIDRFSGKRNEAILKTENYSVYKRYDERLDSYYIELFGALSSGEQIFIRTNFENIQDSVDLANTFYAYIGILAMIVGVVVMFFISKRFTKPIKELAGIADEMKNLNFEAKYKSNRKDEIGKLGESINSLSGTLEETISELKSANNELQKDIEKKEEIDEMRREFLSNVSHELKTPIALIQGYAEGLKDNVNDDEESRNFYCDVITDEALKMNNLVKKLLTLNQIEFGNDQVEYERFDLNALIESVVNNSAIMFKQKNIQPELRLDDNIYVWADEYRIEEVITNYVTNAINYASGNEFDPNLHVLISARKGNKKVRVGVFNSGSQIPEEEIPKIWEKFYKIDKARTREYGGSGVGLSIVKAIMESMNNKYGVMNYENGVEFWFELDMD